MSLYLSCAQTLHNFNDHSVTEQDLVRDPETSRTHQCRNTSVKTHHMHISSVWQSDRLPHTWCQYSRSAFRTCEFLRQHQQPQASNSKCFLLFVCHVPEHTQWGLDPSFPRAVSAWHQQRTTHEAYIYVAVLLLHHYKISHERHGAPIYQL